tara:strand:- start:436 stop:636 length:201 start_codon:yes stop_codon:yes gene_type:complete
MVSPREEILYQADEDKCVLYSYYEINLVNHKHGWNFSKEISKKQSLPVIFYRTIEYRRNARCRPIK